VTDPIKVFNPLQQSTIREAGRGIAGLAPQLPLYKRDEALEGPGVSAVPRDEEPGHVAWR
jgi:hypothetical protein